MSVATRSPIAAEQLEVIATSLASAAPVVEIPVGGERRWVKVATTDAFDAWLILWPHGTAIGMHDHGGSRAAVRVVRGTLVERHLDSEDRSQQRVRHLAAGDTVHFGPEHVHAIVNEDAVEAISVHVYSPPLGPMSYYD
jgi:predicted metal-dependent enzyme (double-stranded beta helix superfamily)